MTAGKLLPILSLSILFSYNVFAQKNDDIPKAPIEVPKIIMDSFQHLYPGIVKAVWNFGAGDYEVEFIKDSIDMTINFDVYGNLTETETEIKTSELPASAADYIKKSYGGFIIVHASKLVSANYDIAYVLQIGKEGKFWDISFDKNGKFLREEEAD